MWCMAEIKVISTEYLEEADRTRGMGRRQASVTDNVSAVEVRTEPGSTSGWHDHGDHDTYGYVLSGALRFESGIEGRDVVTAKAGGFFFVPARTIHREGNPGSEVQVLIGFRVGTGPTVINVDGPQGSSINNGA